MDKSIFAMVGPFVPANEPMTLIPYKQLRLLNATIYAATLDYNQDPSLIESLNDDPNYKKFHRLDFGHYNDTLFSIHNVNLLKALWCRRRYIQHCIHWYDDHPTDIIYSSAFPQFNHSAALAIKTKHPTVHWVANFTDPINHSPYKYDERTYQQYSWIEKIAFKVYCHYYVVDAIEAQCLEQADALIFICEEQRDFMLEQYSLYFNHVALETLQAKSYVYPLNFIKAWEDPVLLRAKKAHSINYLECDQTIRIGHFGRVYGLRLCAEFIEAIRLLIAQYPHLHSRLIIEQYGEFQKSDKALIHEYGLEEVFRLYEKLPYRQYMDRLEQCDAVLIFDTILPEEMIQPYLPSKVLEYSLLQKDTLSITTSRSPLYRICKASHALVAKYDRHDILDQLLLLLHGERSRIQYCYENKDLISIMKQAFGL